MEQPRVIGHVVSVHGFRLKVELSAEAKSPSRATLDGVQRAVAINSFLTFDLGAGIHAIGNLTDLEARESYDPAQGDELTLELTKPRRIASVQLLGIVKQEGKSNWRFDTGITVLPTLDTPAEVANPDILKSVFGNPPRRNRPQGWNEGDYDLPIEVGHQSGDENTQVRASFNDLFSRPLAIVGNTGSGKSYTVASLIRSIIEDEAIGAGQGVDPHVFVLDINGEYANAFLAEGNRNYPRDPNKAYVNGKEFAVPLWLMNSEEVSEWLSAAEQTQQPVLKAWWALLKSQGAEPSPSRNDYLDEALASIRDMYPLNKLTKNDARSRSLAISDFLKETDIDLTALREAVSGYFIEDHDKGASVERGKTYKNFYGATVESPTAIDNALKSLMADITEVAESSEKRGITTTSGDTPTYISLQDLRNTSALIAAASQEDAPRIEQHLTTLRMRLKTRLSDRRWSIFTNYEELGISSTHGWFTSLGFAADGARVVILDLSMLAHEVLPFICATIGRVLLEAREKLPASKRYSNPWVLVLEEAHNYARPSRQIEDRGQALSRKAFERVAKEGRKFGMSLVVASQRPSEISPTIISQCANFFSHRLQNPDDIEHFRRIIPKQAQRLLDQVTVLSSGEAIMFGSAVHVPSRVQINKPKQEPWSITAAPYADWKHANCFPLDDVLVAWGIEQTVQETEPQLEPAAQAVPAAAVEQPASEQDLDDDIPF